MNDNLSLLHQNLNKRARDSKKFISGALGVFSVLVVWTGTITCMFLKVEAAAQFVSLATIVISFLGAIITSLITGQSAMEWKTMSAVATVDTNQTLTENKNENISYKEEKILKLDKVDPKYLDEEFPVDSVSEDEIPEIGEDLTTQ